MCYSVPRALFKSMGTRIHFRGRQIPSWSLRTWKHKLCVRMLSMSATCSNTLQRRVANNKQLFRVEGVLPSMPMEERLRLRCSWVCIFSHIGSWHRFDELLDGQLFLRGSFFFLRTPCNLFVLLLLAEGVSKIWCSCVSVVVFSKMATTTYAGSPAVTYAARVPVTCAAPAVTYAAAAPAVTYAAPAPVTYAAPAVSYTAPAVSYTAPAPAVTYAAPAVSYTAPAVSYTAPAPAVTYAAPRPVTFAAAAPAVTYGAPAVSCAAASPTTVIY